MDICLACYGDRLASVLDNAAELKMYRISGEEFYPAGHLSLPSKDPMDRTSAIMACGVKLLICGAVCGRTLRMLNSAGMTVIPWIRGGADEVAEAFVQDRLESLAMPGCMMRRRQGRACERNSGFGRNIPWNKS